MNIKKGDNVKIISGKDKGKKGKIVQIFPTEKRVVVEGVNKLYRHTRPKRQGEKGQKIEFFAPLSVANVMIICPKCGKQSRVGSKSLNGKKKRVCKKCQEAF